MTGDTAGCSSRLPTLRRQAIPQPVKNIPKSGAVLGNVLQAPVAQRKRKATSPLGNPHGTKRPLTANNRGVKVTGTNSFGNGVKKVEKAPKAVAPKLETKKQNHAEPKRKIPAWDTKALLEEERSKIAKLSQHVEVLKAKVDECQDAKLKYDAALVEINDLDRNLKKAKGQLELKAQLEVKLQDLQQENAHLKDCIDNQTQEIVDLKSELTEKSTKLEVAEGAVHEKIELIASLHNVIAENKKERESLQVQNQELLDRIFNLDNLRKGMHNQIQDLKGNIRVCCRVRPRLLTEASKPLSDINCLTLDSLEVRSSTDIPGTASAHKSRSCKYHFNRVFSETACQEEVYSELSELVQSVLDGYNVCVFAYGVTGSGKTYTMDGIDDEKHKGVIPRTIDTIFHKIGDLEKLGWQYSVQISTMEIYNEVIRDLLNINHSASHEIKELIGPKSQKTLIVTNVEVKEVKAAEEVHAILKTAKKNRSVAATTRNTLSSRSHAITKVDICGENEHRKLSVRGTLYLVDLAGSERLDDDMLRHRQEETININKSLTQLGIVILDLSQGKKVDQIDYRSSKLTRLLKPCLGGNAKTLMFVNISPLEDTLYQSFKSLGFAMRVMDCKQKVVKNT